MTGILYILHPGTVLSRVDGQIHYVTYSQLRELYGLENEKCQRADDRKSYDFTRTDTVHLYPRPDGHYLCPVPRPALRRQGVPGNLQPPAVIVIFSRGEQQT